MKYHVYIYDSFSSFLSVYERKDWFNVKTDFWPKKLLLENSQLSLSKEKNWILLANSSAITPQVREDLGMRMFNS